MSALKQKMGRLRVRAGLLVGASAAVLAIAGVSASSAMAVTGTPNCNQEINIQGAGSSLQRVAQEVWTGRTVPSGTPLGGLPHAANAIANSYREKCAAKLVPPTVSYTSIGSGMALETFGYQGALNPELAYIGTDDGPSAAEILAAEGESGSPAVILPVTQTAIAVMAHLPSGCTLEKITWGELNKVFGGKGIKKWTEFSNASSHVAGGPCDHEITRVVRSDKSGTTLQFKNYLSTLETTAGILAEGLPCTVAVGHTKWGEITEGSLNTSWPCTVAEGGTPIVAKEGGGGVAGEVEKTENTIGYAALPDAEAHTTGVTLEKLQNGTSGGLATYAEPGNNATKNARCANARYTVPAAGIRKVGNTGLSVVWSGVYGAQPKVGGAEYPLCTLTYIAAWEEYLEPPYGANHEKIERLVGDFVMNYVIQTGAGLGQKAIEGKWYSALPVGLGVGTNTDVQDSAEFIAENLSE